MPVMGEIKGKTVTAKLWVPATEVESQALDQVRNVASLEPVVAVSIMPDVHLGKGACIGSVIGMKDAIAPALTGVDIGCVDAKTEFLSQTGWKKISDFCYETDRVLQYHADTGQTSFAIADGFIKKECDFFYHIKTKYGVDQMLCPDHRVLHYNFPKRGNKPKLQVTLAQDIFEQHSKNVLGWSGQFITSFKAPETNTRIPLSNSALRVQIMTMADGSFGSSGKTTWCRCSFKKERKITRAKDILSEANIEYKYKIDNYGVTHIDFYAPWRDKHMKRFWAASPEQIDIISDEVLYWDGSKKEKCFYTRDKSDADFINYVFSAAGYRSTIIIDTRESGIDYRVFAHTNTVIGIRGTPKTPIQKVKSPDGYKYCFTLPTGFWIMRRNGRIAVTGNCGMEAVKTDLFKDDLSDKQLKKIYDQIKRDVPVGFQWHEEGSNKPIFTEHANSMDQYEEMVPKELRKDQNENRVLAQMGTLGGGNHFIEVSHDEDNRIWLMLHSGSRNIGYKIADYYIKKAIQKMPTGLPDKALAYFKKEGEEFEEYWNAMQWAQRYAANNRAIMMAMVESAVRQEKSFETLEHISCHHNFAEMETHPEVSDVPIIVVRKGAVESRDGQMAIIPGAMGRDSYIVRGRGNSEALRSAPHGAGRKMSRSKAKKKYTKEQLAKTLDGIIARTDKDVVDEICYSYKDINKVIGKSSDLVVPIAKLNQLMCIKG